MTCTYMKLFRSGIEMKCSLEEFESVQRTNMPFEYEILLIVVQDMKYHVDGI